MSRRPLALVLAGALAAGLLAAVAPPAKADVAVNEIYPVPASGVYDIEGHGWGHGTGMSQHGARNAGAAGKTADYITAHYYPSTAKGALANVRMRIRLMADNDNRTEVYPTTDLKIGDVGSGATAALPTTVGTRSVTRWRTTLDSAGMHLQYRDSAGTWRAYAIGGRTTFAGPLEFYKPTFIRVAFPDGTSRDYRGVIRSVKRTATTLGTYNVLPMESYLLGVVPREAPSGWSAPALQAQAIAARSYSAFVRRPTASGPADYDLCDTTACQVYGGSALYSAGGTKTSLEPASTSSAVRATAGVVRTYGGKPIFSQFSSSNGGWSTAGQVHGQSVPYLIAKADSWDGAAPSSVHFWTAKVSAAQIQAAFPAVGRLLRMRVTSRDGNGDWRGRVKVVVLEGVNSSGAGTSVTTTGRGIYQANTWPARSDGLKSSWWRVKPSYNAVVTSKSSAPRLVQTPGVSRGRLTVTVRNTGTRAWSTSALHLAVTSPVGGADPLVGGSTRPGRYTGTATSIAPDSTATFSFALTGDGVDAGLHSRSYRLRIGTGSLFGPTISWRVQVNKPTFVGSRLGGPVSTAGSTSSDPQAPGPVLADGSSVVPVAGSTSLKLTYRNASNVAWPVTSGGPVRLGTSAPRNRQSASSGPAWITPGTRTSSLSASAPVQPGQTGTFGVVLYGNNKPAGVTTETFEPVWQGYSWISGASTTLRVVRVNPAVERLAVVDLKPPATLTRTNAPNGTATLVVRMRNTGGATWKVGEEKIWASASAEPLATSAWTTSRRPPPLARNVTRPMISSVYPGEVGEWRVPLSARDLAAGTYVVRLRLISPTGTGYGPEVRTDVTVVAASFTGSVTRTSASVRVPSSGTATTSFDVKNTGNVSWPIGTDVRSWAQASGGSPSRATSWLTPTQPSALRSNLTRPGATTLRPGEVGRFTVVLAGNGRTPRTTSEPFGALWNGWRTLSGVRATLPYQVV